MTNQKSNILSVWLWPALIMLALVLRIYHLDAYGIWHDERVSMLNANGQFFGHEISGVVSSNELQGLNDLQHVVHATVLDNGNGLVYNTMLHYWLCIFGNNDFSARMLSVLFGVMLIPLIFHFTRRLTGNNEIAFFAAGFAIVHPLFIGYAQQARSYTAATFFTLYASHVFIRLIRNEGNVRSFALYTVLVTISLLTHYLTASVYLAHAIIFVWMVRDKRTWIQASCSLVAVILLMGIWMLNGGLDGWRIMEQQNARYALQAASWQEGMNSFAMPASIKNIVTGWAQVWLQVFGNQMQNFGFRIREFAVMLLIPLSLIFMLGRSVWSEKSGRNVFFTLLILTFTQIVFASFQAISSGHCISFQPLYASFVVPYAIVLIAWGIFSLNSGKSKRVASVLMIFFSLIMAVSCFTTWFNLSGKKPAQNDHIAKANEFVQNWQEGDTLIVKSSMDLRLFSIYLPEDKNFLMKVDSSLVDDSYDSERWK